jgi:predicted TPR repeat methyltransferase
VPLGYKLEVHGRYAHTKQYIENVTKHAGLELISINQADLRKELEKQVDGWIVSTKKPG